MSLQKKRVRISMINQPLPSFLTFITLFVLSTAIFIIVSSKEETTELSNITESELDVWKILIRGRRSFKRERNNQVDNFSNSHKIHFDPFFNCELVFSYTCLHMFLITCFRYILFKYKNCFVHF